MALCLGGVFNQAVGFAVHARICLVVAMAASGAIAVACSAFTASEDDALPPTDDGGTLDGGGADGTTDGAAAVCVFDEAPDAGVKADCDGTGLPVDLATADKHCGRCGHDCLGTGCNGGRCVVKPASTGDYNYTAVTVATSEYIYYSSSDFADNSHVRRLALADGAVTTLSTLSGTGALNGPGVSGASVFAVHAPRGVLAFPIGGGQGNTVVDDPYNVDHLVVDNTNLYWVKNYAVLARPHADGPDAGATFVVNYDPAFPHITRMVADGARVYWAASSVPIGTAGPVASALKMRGPARTDSSVTRVSGVTANITTLAFDVDYIYYSTDVGEIWRAAKATAAPPELVTRISGVRRWAKGLAVDDTSVYAAMTPSNLGGDVTMALIQASKICGPPRVLADSQISAVGLVSAGKFLYWGSFGTVDRLVK
jgi:hypothetical protein